MRIYKTISGDFWDVISKKVYGSEGYTSFLMQNNIDKIDYFIFPEGVKLKIEDLPKMATTLPGWRS